MVVERNHLIHLASDKVCNRKDLNHSTYLLTWHADEIDRVRKQRRISDATSLTTLASATFTGPSLEQLQAPSPLSRRGQVITAKTSQSQPVPSSAPECGRTSLPSHEQALDVIETSLTPGVMDDSDMMNLDSSTLVSEMSAKLHIKSHDNHAHLAFQVKLLFDLQTRHDNFIEATGENVDFEAQNICLAKDFHQFCFEVCESPREFTTAC